MRSAAHLCPVPGCGNMRDRWAAVCRTCWRRLPFDYRAPIKAAKEAKAKHLEAKAAIAATQWLIDHPPAGHVARIMGEQGEVS